MKKSLSFIICALMLCGALSVIPVGAIAGDTVRYGGSTVSDPAIRTVYDTLVRETANVKTSDMIEFSESEGISADALRAGYNLFRLDYPERFWIPLEYEYAHRSGHIVSVAPKYKLRGEALANARAELERAIEEIFYGLPSGGNYEKALYLHDRLVERVDYELVGEHQTAYGALVSGKAVCAGYAAAYQLLLNRAGISAATVTGFSKRPDGTTLSAEAHAWNLVFIEDGVCVYTDLTWNDSGDGTYHYYFNLSRSEIEQDHSSDGTLPLPACTHTAESYFDNTGKTLGDGFAHQELASLFGPAVGNERHAVFSYTGADIEGLKTALASNQSALYSALGCGSGTCTYQLTIIGREVHMTVTANFKQTGYMITVKLPENIAAENGETQIVEIGRPMATMNFHAHSGYYFPSDYAGGEAYGLSITPIDERTVRITGTPTANVTVTLIEPVKMQKEKTPTASFTSSGAGRGTLSGIGAGMAYSTDGESWTEIKEDGDIELSGLKNDKIYVLRRGNGKSTLDSDPITLTVRPLEPETTPEIKPTDTARPSESEPQPQTKPLKPSNDFGCGAIAGAPVSLIVLAATEVFLMIKKRKI